MKNNKPTKLKRFLVFMYSCYYPAGGWNDFQGSFDSKEEIMMKCKVTGESAKEIKFLDEYCGHEFLEIVDTLTGECFEYGPGDIK